MSGGALPKRRGRGLVVRIGLGARNDVGRRRGALEDFALLVGLGVGDLIGRRERPDLILAEARPVGLGERAERNARARDRCCKPPCRPGTRAGAEPCRRCRTSPEKLQLWRGGFGWSASLCASASPLEKTSAAAARASAENLTRIIVELPCERSASFRRSRRGLRPRQHRIGDRRRDRLRLLREAQNRHDDEKEREIAERQDARDDRQPLGRLLRAEIAEANADRDKDPEEKADRTGGTSPT